jgi:hypothetical protein
MGKQPLCPGTLRRRNVTPAIEQAGIAKPKLGWHSLRRSCASLLLSTGASLRVSIELMRHSTAEMRSMLNNAEAAPLSLPGAMPAVETADTLIQMSHHQKTKRKWRDLQDNCYDGYTSQSVCRNTGF